MLETLLIYIINIKVEYSINMILCCILCCDITILNITRTFVLSWSIYKAIVKIVKMRYTIVKAFYYFMFICQLFCNGSCLTHESVLCKLRTSVKVRLLIFIVIFHNFSSFTVTTRHTKLCITGTIFPKYIILTCYLSSLTLYH